jgi:hypothetical protein
MRPRLLRDAGGWGVLLWLVGYLLGVLLFAFVPARVIGWIITPVGTAMTLWVAFRKLTGDSLRYFTIVGLVWLAIAVVGDYVFIVKAFSPPDGYYKLDVYVYYALTLAIPLAAGWRRTQR